AKGTEDTDREDRDGDGGRDGEAGAEADIAGDGAEQESEQRAEDDGADGELGEGFFRGDVSAKFARRGRGTPGTIGHKSSIQNAVDEKGARGLCRRAGTVGSGFGLLAGSGGRVCRMGDGQGQAVPAFS